MSGNDFTLDAHEFYLVRKCYDVVFLCYSRKRECIKIAKNDDELPFCTSDNHRFFATLKNSPQLLHEKLSIVAKKNLAKIGKIIRRLSFPSTFFIASPHHYHLCDDRIISKPSLHTVVCKP